MSIEIVVVDAGQLAKGVEFPPLKIPKYSWEEYPGLDAEGIEERCWRTDVVVVMASAISGELLKKMHRLSLLITVGEACHRLDQAAALEQGVELLAFLDADGSNEEDAQDLCDRIVQAIEHYVANGVKNEENV
ncbi:hypothetical protein DFR30_0416 [Thiogranum longum]|uniref:Uncharacterized protein n=2 Tax=Thiogranum longum TaxID=1537524 RepID=A0A4R1HAK1_9GAMM|nr:hypothetical protein DFR30_0416 [Thiogranum longum]